MIYDFVGQINFNFSHNMHNKLIIKSCIVIFTISLNHNMANYSTKYMLRILILIISTEKVSTSISTPNQYSFLIEKPSSSIISLI